MSDTTNNVQPSDGVVPKVCGSDVELGNFIISPNQLPTEDTCGDAARALLAQIQGFVRPPIIPPSSYNNGNTVAAWYGSADYQEYGGSAPTQYGYQQYAQDSGRRFLPGGGAAYIDLNHLEICTPECASALEHLAAARARLLLARDAMDRANRHMPPNTRITVLANNSDRRGNSYGSHINILTTRQAFDNTIYRKMHYLQFLASAQVASIVLTGAGEVGSRDSGGNFNISSRALVMQRLVSEATTFRRPIVNARDEPLCGTGEADARLARMHIIFFDHCLCDHAGMLAVGLSQLNLAMLEQEQVPTQLLLDDPVAAVHHWTRDPELNARAKLVNGRKLTAVELLQAIFDHTQRFVAAGRAEGIVPEVGRIMEIWGSCMEMLRRRDMQGLASRIDWVAKKFLLDRAAAKWGQWDPIRARFLDNLWSSLDPNEGLYWILEKAGAVERLVSAADVERSLHEPSDHTRAWLRSWAIRHADEIGLDDMDWDMLRLRIQPTHGEYWSEYLSLYMPDPRAYTRAQCQAVLAAAASPLAGLRQILSPANPSPTSTPSSNCLWPATQPLGGSQITLSSFD